MQGIFAEQTYDVILFNDIGLHAWTARPDPRSVRAADASPLANLRKFAPSQAHFAHDP